MPRTRIVNSNFIRQGRRRQITGAVGLIGAAALLIGGCASSSSSSSSGLTPSGTIPVGLITSLTGAYQIIAQPQEDGTEAAVYVINKAGGVLGHKLRLYTADDGSDPVEGASACSRLVQVDHVVGSVGPPYPMLPPCIPTFNQAGVAAFNPGGTPVFDSNTNPLLFRNETSDGQTGTAMGLWACHMGYRTGVLMMEAEPTAQAFKPYVAKGFASCGGRIIGSEDLQSNQSEYRTEVAKVIALKPNVIFTEVPSAAGPMWANFKELDNLAIPFIGSDSTVDPNFVKAIGGPAVAHKSLTSLTGATPAGSAYNSFAALLKQRYHATPAGDAPWTYDAMIDLALAMDAAHSTKGTVYTKYMKQVTNPPGTVCTSYASCLALLKQGKKINYEGASGTNNFNANNNVFSTYNAVKCDLQGNFVTIGTVSAAQLNSASK